MPLGPVIPELPYAEVPAAAGALGDNLVVADSFRCNVKANTL